MSRPRRALVLGGTGFVGAAVVGALAREGVRVVFTYRERETAARTLADEHGARAERIDLESVAAVPDLLARLSDAADPIDVAVHCAATLAPEALVDLDDAAWERSSAVNARSAFQLCRGLGRSMGDSGGGEIVLVGGLDRSQSLPIPPAFAATQGMLGALAMAAAKELGPRGVRVNMVALGLLEGGLSLGLPEALREDYLAFSALRRLGTRAEVATFITWMALRNTYVSGKVLTCHGGI